MDTLIAWTLGLAFVAAWLTHVATCLAAGMWGFLVADRAAVRQAAE